MQYDQIFLFSVSLKLCSLFLQLLHIQQFLSYFQRNILFLERHVLSIHKIFSIFSPKQYSMYDQFLMQHSYIHTSLSNYLSHQLRIIQYFFTFLSIFQRPSIQSQVLQHYKSMSSSKKMRLKIAVIGPSKSGKTSFINNICNKLHKSQQSPESYEVVLHKITSGNRQYEIQLWNCGSQHMSYNKYIRNAFFKNCSAAFLIFDLSKPFQVWKQEVKQWINEAYEFDCFLIYAIGTKGDYKNNRKEKFPVGQLSQSLNQIQIFQETNINSFFQEYQIEHFFQNATERVSSKIRNIFLKIQNDQYKLTRGSLAVPKKMESSFMGKDSLIRPRQQYNETIISIKQEQIQ